MLHLFLADGFEEIEALATLDFLRRCGLDVATVSIMGRLEVCGAHGVHVQADALFAECTDALAESEALILPGGMPGAAHLTEFEPLTPLLELAKERKALIAAICAAPMALGRRGLLRGRRVTCYPGFEPELTDAMATGEQVVADGQFITGRGPGATFEFAAAIAEGFVGGEKVGEVRRQMCFV